MNYHQSNVFLQDLSNSFHSWLNLFVFDSSGVSKLFMVVFCRRHSQHLKTEEEFLFNLALFSSRFMVLACCHPLIIVFDCENLFHPSGDIQESSRFVIRSPSIQVYSFSAVSYHSPILPVHLSNIL